MPKIEWDKSGEKLYEAGVDHGVLYQSNAEGKYVSGVPWNGLTTVTQSPSGAEANDSYADNIKYMTILSAEEFGGTIEAYTYPEEFGQNDGTANLAKGVSVGQQTRKPFGMSYRTKIGNDIDGQDHGYKLHLQYGMLASPSEKSYTSINDSPEGINFSWEFTTTPVNVPDHKPTALLTIDSTKADKEKLAALEAILYGSDSAEPRMPLPAEIIEIFEEVAG